MQVANIKTKLEAEVHYSVIKDEQKKHIDHINFALDLVEDIDNYNDGLFIFYSRKVERMKRE